MILPLIRVDKIFRIGIIFYYGTVWLKVVRIPAVEYDICRRSDSEEHSR
jgi:hypothetical protein